MHTLLSTQLYSCCPFEVLFTVSILCRKQTSKPICSEPGNLAEACCAANPNYTVPDPPAPSIFRHSLNLVELSDAFDDANVMRSLSMMSLCFVVMCLAMLIMRYIRKTRLHPSFHALPRKGGEEELGASERKRSV